MISRGAERAGGKVEAKAEEKGVGVRESHTQFLTMISRGAERAGGRVEAKQRKGGCGGGGGEAS